MDTYNEIWNAVLSYCEQRVTETAFNLWIKKTEFVSFEAATITLRLPSAMYMDVVISQYGTMLNRFVPRIMTERNINFIRISSTLRIIKTSNTRLKILLSVQATDLLMLRLRLLQATQGLILPKIQK